MAAVAEIARRDSGFAAPDSLLAGCVVTITPGFLMLWIARKFGLKL
ncbi:hypothetical protein MASR1M32_27130 [Rhodobacter sp.]